MDQALFDLADDLAQDTGVRLLTVAGDGEMRLATLVEAIVE
jgi:hypothetical protein